MMFYRVVLLSQGKNFVILLNIVIIPCIVVTLNCFVLTFSHRRCKSFFYAFVD